MTAKQFKAKYSNEDLNNAQTLLYDMVSYLEEVEMYAVNSIDIFTKAADALPLDIDDL